MQAETAFKLKVRTALKDLAPLWFVKTQQVAIRGTPDILCCIKGRFVALELKRNDQEEADPLQLHNLRLIEEAGGLAFVANPTNWPHILQVLRDLAYT